MSAELAQTILIAIAGIGFIVWLIALRFLLVTSRMTRTVDAPTTEDLSVSESRAGNCFFGSADVEGEPDALIEKALGLLAKMSALGPGAFGPLKIVERSKDRIVFEKTGLAGAAPAYAGGYRQGIFRFAALGKNRTRIDYAIEFDQGRWMLGLGWAFQMVGLLVLSVGCWVVYNFCVTSPDPNVRVQSVQMVQASHFLWPPFLLGGLYRQRRNAVYSAFDALVHNLPYYSAG
jgi:hypothetical protein